jgi:UDP-glucose 4-epimerase
MTEDSTPKLNEMKHGIADHSKLQRTFGYTPHFLKKGVQAMARWAKSIGNRKSKEFENIEITKNFPPSWVS